MDTAWMESLLSLVEHGSFTRAAEAQHLSQSAFSRRIRSLERWIGTDLVDRSMFPATLTPAGIELAAYAREAVVSLAELRDEARGRQLAPHQPVRIAISHTLAMYFFADWWTSVRGGNDGPTCQLLPSNTLEAYDTLLHGGCDLLLAYADPAHPIGIDKGELEWVVVATDQMAPFSIAQGGQPTFTLPGTTARPVPFVTHGSGAFLGRVTDRLIGPLNLCLLPVAQSDLTAALVGLVQAGVGVGWLPGQAAGPAVAAAVITPLEEPAWCTALEVRLYRHKTHRAGYQASVIWEQACA